MTSSTDPSALAAGAPLGDGELRLLRVYKAVVECGGFSAAESVLDIARSTISTHIARLEARTGLRLCERGRAGFALTEHGRLVYQEAVTLLAAVDAFRAHVHAAHRRLRGELNVGVIDHLLTVESLPLADALARFGRAAPEVHVGLRVLSADEIERGLADGRLHAGILVPHRRRPGLDYRDVAGEIQRLYCARDHALFTVPDARIDEARIESAAFVGRSYLDEARAVDRPFRAPPAASANNLEAILALILSGRFLGLLPEQYARPWAERGEIRALRPDLVTVEKTFTLVTRRARARAPALDAFLGAFDAALGRGVG